MRCPICAQAELEHQPGPTSLRGLLHRPDRLACPECGSVAEHRKDRLRFLHIPSPYGAFAGPSFQQRLSPERAAQIGAELRHMVRHAEAIRAGEFSAQQPPLPLKSDETCIYVEPAATLQEARTREGQAYWADTQFGALVLTDKRLYIDNYAIPLNKIDTGHFQGKTLDFSRSDRKRRQRLVFSDVEDAYFATLAIAQQVPVIPEPQLDKEEFSQKPSGWIARIPLGKGRKIEMPALLAPIPAALLVAVFACLSCFGLALGDTLLHQAGPLPTYTLRPTVTPTSVSRLASVLEATDTPLPTSTPEPTNTPSHTPTSRPSSTPTSRPSNTPSPTATSGPTNTPSSTPTRRPTAIPSPTSTHRPTSTPSSTVAATFTPEPTSTPTPVPQPARVAAQVVDVVDGDTIKVNVGGEIHSVRYIGIDAPETVDPNQPVQPMGPEATAANRDLVAGKTVYLEKDVSETDRYGRLLRYVWLADGVMVNAELVRLGYAQVSTYPPDVAYQDHFLNLQAEAREAGLGLWGSLPEPTPEPQQPTAAPTQAAAGEVIISYIYYDGQVPRVESDEYAVIKNVGGSPVNLAGWRLNAGNPGQDFVFPQFELQPGQECRVYTNEIHPESGGFSFSSGQAIWYNKGDCGFLYDNTGAEVHSRCY